jgi:hypothetical protein
VVDPETHLASALDPGLRFVNHSPTGFEWGYGGSGPAQLAFAILLDHLKSAEQARLYYQDFKDSLIAKLSADTWELTSEQVERVLRCIYRARANSEDEDGQLWGDFT